MKYLVLGGAGYIGSHFVKKVIQDGHEVVVFDNLINGHVEAVDSKAVFIQGDILDESALSKVFETHKIDACIHFAAFSLVRESMQVPNKYFKNNVSGTLSLLETMQKYNVKKIVFSSSAAVYGAHKIMPITEEFPLNPTNPYGESKLQMERMMHWADKAYGIRFVSLRYFNVAGASSDASIGEDHHPETHLIPIVLEVPRNVRPFITIFGNDYNTLDGTCVRDYIHIDDLVDAHIKALDYLNRNQPSNIFNLGTEKGLSNLEIVEVARKITNHPIPIKIGPRRLGDPDILVASYHKALRVLNWAPQKGIEEIISSAWEFHLTHPNGFKEETNES